MGIDNLKVNTTDKTWLEFQDSGTSNGFDDVKNSIADKLQSVADVLGEHGSDQAADCPMAKYGKQASEWLDHSAEYVRKFDYKQADSSIREYVKQSPGRSLFMAGAVGLIIGALLRRR